MATTDEERSAPDRRRATAVDGTLVALLAGGAAGAVAAVQGDVSGVAVLGVVLGAAVALGGLVALPAMLR